MTLSRRQNPVLTTILSRHSVSPKKLIEPAPTQTELEDIIQAAVTAPDHGRLRPWRFVLFPKSTREDLAQIFEQALLERLPDASHEDRDRARAKAGRGPLLLGIIVRLDQDEVKQAAPQTERVRPEDQYASAGAAIQNILLTSHALGYGARVTSGRAVHTSTFRKAMNLSEEETFLCFISIGSYDTEPKPKPRPQVEEVLSEWRGIS